MNIRGIASLFALVGAFVASVAHVFARLAIPFPFEIWGKYSILALTTLAILLFISNVGQWGLFQQDKAYSARINEFIDLWTQKVPLWMKLLVLGSIPYSIYVTLSSEKSSCPTEVALNQLTLLFCDQPANLRLSAYFIVGFLTAAAFLRGAQENSDRGQW